MYTRWIVLATWMRARFGDTERGASLVEYALLIALIALVCVGVITSTGSGVQSIFSDISAELTKANP